MAAQAPTRPESAQRHYLLSALIAQRAVAQARVARPRGIVALARAVHTHQVTQAVMSERAVAEMLAEQDIDAAAEAMLNSLAFTTEANMLAEMADATTTDAEFDRLVESLVQDAGRAAESVAAAVRANVVHVRFLSPPSCKRCAVLANRVYRWSEGFKRHPNCDCVMIPSTVAAAVPQDVEQLAVDGMISDLTKAERKALDEGADLGQMVNVRRQQAGLRESGRVLARRDRLTPEGIYRLAGDDRTEAVRLLAQYGYIT